MTATEEPTTYDYAERRRPRGVELPSWAWDCPQCHGAGWLRGDWQDTSKGRARQMIPCPCGLARRGPVEQLGRPERMGQ